MALGRPSRSRRIPDVPGFPPYQLEVVRRQWIDGKGSPRRLAPAPLYKAFVSARNEAERRNCCFRADADDLRREWPEVLRAVARVAGSPSEADLASFRAEVATGAANEAVLAYLHLLRQDVLKELELRYRHLLG